MLISHRRRFIFTKTNKTGGTSVESYFEPECLPEGQWVSTHYREETVTEAGIIGFRGLVRPPECRWYNHMSASQIRSQIGEELWNSYFKFTIVRNPYDKAVSAFYFRAPLEPGQPFRLDDERARFASWLESNALTIDCNKFLIDNQVCVDRLLRYESLERELAEVCHRLEIPWEPERMPKFKAGLRPPEATVAALYTPQTRASVERAYDWELQHLGYGFPE